MSFRLRLCDQRAAQNKHSMFVLNGVTWLINQNVSCTLRCWMTSCERVSGETEREEKYICHVEWISVSLGIQIMQKMRKFLGRNFWNYSKFSCVLSDVWLIEVFFISSFTINLLLCIKLCFHQHNTIEQSSDVQNQNAIKLFTYLKSSIFPSAAMVFPERTTEKKQKTI